MKNAFRRAAMVTISGLDRVLGFAGMSNSRLSLFLDKKHFELEIKHTPEDSLRSGLLNFLKNGNDGDVKNFLKNAAVPLFIEKPLVFDKVIGSFFKMEMDPDWDIEKLVPKEEHEKDFPYLCSTLINAGISPYHFHKDYLESFIRKGKDIKAVAQLVSLVDNILPLAAGLRIDELRASGEEEKAGILENPPRTVPTTFNSGENPPPGP